VKRAAARLGLLAVLGGVPFALGSLLGPPGLPSWGASGGLSDTYLPVEAVLEVLGLLAWALWAYLAFAVLLHGTAVLAASRGLGPHRSLLAASSLLTPKTLRHLVEVAVSGTLLAASVSARVAASHPPAVVASMASLVEVEEMSRGVTSAAEHRVKQTYRVRPGDSLWGIAERELGSGFRWRGIYHLNRGRQFSDGRILTHPYLIYAGWVLELPVERKASPPRSGRPGPDSRPAEHEQETPEPAPIPPHNPLETQTPPSEPAPEGAGRDQETEEPKAAAPTDPAFRTPSGVLVAASFASGLLTAHLLGRLRRRRARRLSGSESAEPPPAPELVQDFRRGGASEMTGPLDVALDAVIEAWRAETGSWPHVLAAVEASGGVSVILEAGDVALPRNSGGSISPLVRFTRAGPSIVAEVEGPFPTRLRRPRSPLERGLLLPIGRAPDGAALHLSATGLGQVSVSGPQTGSLMRQLVLSAATQGGPDDLRVLFLGAGGEVKGLRPLPQVEGSYGWGEASATLREVQLELTRRARLFMDEGVEDVNEHLAKHPDERLPALLVVCEEPPSALQELVQAVGQEAQALGAAVLALGWAPRECRVRARVNAAVEVETDLPCPKVVEPFLLATGAEEQAIEVIREAYPPESAEEPPGGETVELVEEPELPRAVELPAERSPDPRPELSLPPTPLEPPAPPPDMMAIRSLGPYEISRGKKPLPTGWKTKGRELVAYLVAHPAGAPKERIVEELWPGIDPELGAGRFDRYATIIRAQARGTGDSRMYVERVGDSYRLQEDAWWVDAWEFERLIREPERTEDVAQAVTKLRDAIALYQGEFCDDAYYAWLEGVQERFRNLFTEASGRLAALLQRADHHDEALSVLNRAIEADPICEDLVRRAMAIEAAIGRRAAALDRYRKFEVTLDRDLGVEPDPETQALVRRLSEKAG
jgi:DNA-binding SARP family transcriptional activator